jgi:hypothetical protein
VLQPAHAAFSTILASFPFSYDLLVVPEQFPRIFTFGMAKRTPLRDLRYRCSVQLAGALFLSTILLVIFHRDFDIHRLVQTFFYPNQACGMAELFVSRGDSSMLPHLPGFQRRNFRRATLLHTETPVSAASHREIFSSWRDVVDASSRFSKMYCESFILYSVLVQHATAEDRLTKAPVARPRISAKHCAVILALRVLTDASEYDSVQSLQKFEQTERRLESLGWKVFSANCTLPRVLSRRASRIPKLSPSIFFPNTERVLYSDIKYLSVISKVEATALARVLLQGAHFGILQHPIRDDLASEGSAITMQAKEKRPTMVDNLDVMREQISALRSKLSVEQQNVYAIDGGLHARVLRGEVNSSFLDALWLDEYTRGCDRDQIAFFGAAARAGLRRVYPFSCQDKFDRAGVYRSTLDRSFTMTIHCKLSRALACARFWT